MVTGELGKPTKKEWEAIQAAEKKIRNQAAADAKKNKRKSAPADVATLEPTRKRRNNLVQLSKAKISPLPPKVLRPIVPKPGSSSASSTHNEGPDVELMQILPPVRVF